ncbi:hypothetical protein D7X99_05875 [Corallococcus sp. AB032C]|uniref:hypothetical protein n=1 Tax=Corallococcus TaxID=83461 RepID=UPI000EE8D0BE|nr:MULTISPECIES: hypothetical protein [Corallococcus]NNB89226.1 hypothetical protein [Corallococcus exiguus]NPC51855.1 hypothetical protein [Corallococcus exiguus]RKH85621.1 hypothetical protein D7X99_05875 [Corallococcus sp. AB032C]
MGMYGEVLGIGPFRRELVPFLQQPAAWHRNTRDGAIIVVSVFLAPEGSSRSRELAGCMGAEAWDFNTHALDPWRVDVEAVRRFLYPGEEHRLECFLRLRDAGFEFFFQPNG